LGDQLGIAPGLMPPPKPRYGDGMRKARPAGPVDDRSGRAKDEATP
jgi:hypothetical protein